MKIIVPIFIFLSIHQQVLAQSASKSADCESLVFNTKELTPFEFNERCKTESYPFISSDGNDLYYTNNQTIDWLFYSQKESSTGKWTVPVPLVIGNFKEPIRSCYFSKDMKTLYFISKDKMYKALSDNGSKTQFLNPEEIEINRGSSIKGPLSYISISDDLTKMYAYVNNPTETATMCEFYQSGENQYTFLKSISTTKKEMGSLSSDGLTYYFTNDLYPNILFCKKRKDLSLDFDATIYIVKSFESNLNVSQVRIAENAGWLAVVLSETVWNKNELYFSRFDVNDSNLTLKVLDEANIKLINETNKQSLVNAGNDVNTSLPIMKREIINTKGAELVKIELGQAFPNPAKNVFYFYYNVISEDFNGVYPVVNVLDNAGRTVYTMSLSDMKGEAKVLLDDVPSGAYMVKLDYNGISSEMIRITISL